MRTKKNIYIQLIMLTLTFAFQAEAWGQTNAIVTTGGKAKDPFDYYNNVRKNNEVTTKTKTKWYYLREMEGLKPSIPDRFEKDAIFTITVDGSNQQVQASHVLIDTIYMHKGSKIKLSLPERSPDEINYTIRSYQRWYNLKTGNTFDVGSVENSGFYSPIRDLLYPTVYQTVDNIKPRRFKNGYIGNPLVSENNDLPLALDMDFNYPTEEQYTTFNNAGYEVNPDNNEYLVACDVSGYTDYSEKFELKTKHSFTSASSTLIYAPTLSLRVIYYVRAIDNENDWRHKFFKEQEGITEPNQQKYLEEYEINMPAIRIPDKTQEMVSMASAPNAYAVPVAAANDTDELTVNLEDGNSNPSGIKLCQADGSDANTLSLKGTNRIIHFKYPQKDAYGREYVPDGSTATILVTKEINSTTYRIARFKLTFKENSVLLTQSQIEDIDANNITSGNPWAKYTYRTPEYLHKNYTFITGLDFDFDRAIAEKYGQKEFYPYPLGWSESSYAFYDGSANEICVTGSTKAKDRDFIIKDSYAPQWGYYAILNDFIECNKTNTTDGSWEKNDEMPVPPTLPNNSKGQPSTYHLYIDASDQPGMIARLKLDQKLCPGSELFVSAWVKVAKEYAPNGANNNAAMLFSIMGVTEGKSGKQKDISYTPIYRHQTGQIPGTYNKNNASNLPNIPGFGSNNEWLHVYFSFINKGETLKDYDSYVLQIDNNSASTAGADMYVDDIRVYIAPTQAEVKPKTPTCKAKNQDALLQMSLNWGGLLSRLGVEEKETSSDGGKAHVSFCFVDSAAYISAYNELSEADKGKEEKCKAVFENSIIPLSYPIKKDDGSEDKTTPYEFGKLLFDPFYESDANMIYKTEETNYQNITKAEDAGHFYRLTDRKAISADIHCALEPFHTYFLILEENHDEVHDDDPYTPDIERFKYFYNNDPTSNSCVAKTSFQLVGRNSIKVNGQISEKTDRTFCDGQIVNFGVQLKADTDDSGELKPITKDVYYDWFLGPMNKFQEQCSGKSFSIHEAIIDFRQDCPDATTPEAWNTTDKKEVLAGQVASGKLILKQANLNANIAKNDGDNFNLVVIPIPVELGASTDNNMIMVCTDPLEVVLNINGNAPVARVGFEDVKYPDETTATPDRIYSTIRVSKAVTTDCNSNNAMLEIPLRNIASGNRTSGTTTAADATSAVSFIPSSPHPHLYLIDSNDPAVLDKIAEINENGSSDGSGSNGAGFDSHTWPVGTIDAISTTTPSGIGTTPATTDQYLRFHFGIETTTSLAEGLEAPNFREGYRYTLLAYFTEASSPSGSCEGNLTFDLKVVPEYQKWIGPADGSGNWHNDANWFRSTANELHKTGEDATKYDKGYTNSDETYYSYVPIDFTKVTIPEGTQMHLYKVEKNTAAVESGASHSIFNLSPLDKPTNISDAATKDIEYDLVAKKVESVTNGVAYNCQTYSPYTIDQIHFEPSTEILHAEYLHYSKAWVDYRLTGSRWYTLASPLQSVVAGDWYTLSTGSQTTEYFKEIRLTGPDGNLLSTYSRFQPSVYQRAWKQQANMITIANNGSSIGSTDPKTVAVSGNWSGVYNDVTVPYTPGEGFSVKVLNLSTTTNSTPATTPATALFRFPKADTQYSYYENGNTTIGSAVDVRTVDEQKKAGKLISDKLSTDGAYTITLGEKTASTDTDYHLIGNPFMAHLSVQKFFETNAYLQKKYWQVTDGNQTAAVGGTDGNDWITNTGTGDATTIAPLQSFFVAKAGTSKADNNTVTFNADMQVLGTPPEATLPLLTLVATTADGRQSRAVIAYDRTSSEEYKADEDAELFLDSNLGDLPSIYTVAGTMAAGINRTSDLWNIPVGIYGNSNENNGNNNETVTLSFEGLDRFTGTTLYDAAKKTETPLHSNSSLTIPANTYGRYFLRAGTPTGNEKIETETIRIYTITHGQLIVTATENLQTVAIYDFAGRLLRYSDTPSGCLFTTHLDKGNYIIRATSEHQQQTSKIQIR